MKETVRAYQRKSLVKTRDALLSTRQTVEQQTLVGKLAESNLSTPQKQASHPRPQSVEKSEKHCIPFTALALVLTLSSLCAIALLGHPPLVRARETLSSSVHLRYSPSLPLDSATPTPDCTMTNDCGKAWGSPFSKLENQIVIQTSGKCVNHKNADTTISDILCLNDTDFFYGNADITCVYNRAQDNDNNSQHPNMIDLLNNAGIHLSANTTTAGTPTATGNQTFTPPLPNENTCTTDITTSGSNCSSSGTKCRICYSTDNTGQDETDHVVHDEGVGGDDVLCFNQACGNISANAPSADYGKLCGTGQLFDKWACNPIPTSSYYYNPTAYNPLGALEMVVTNIRKTNHLITTSIHIGTPHCEGGQWACSDNSNIVMNLYQAALGGANMNNPTSGADGNGHNAAFTTDNPEVVSASPISITTSQYFKDAENPNKMSSSKVSLPPIYLVTCTTRNTGSGLHFPCSDNSHGKINLAVIQQDWLSGNGQNNYGTEDAAKDNTGGVYPAGHLSTTYNKDTIDSTLLRPLFSSMLAVAYVILGPIAVLIGYHLLWASLTLRNSPALEDFGRMLLGVIAIGLSFQIVSLLLGLTNLLNHGIILLHQSMPYTNMLNVIGGTSDTAYVLTGDTDLTSFRGVVQPIVRWGCVINIFVEILSSKFWTDMASFVPFVGGIIQLVGQIIDAVEIFKHIGEFMKLLLSISLCVQVYLRILFINYYIVTAPVVFACWALPGGVGGKVLGEWLKGFFSILIVQTIQLFVLTTMPLLLPPMPSYTSALGNGLWGLVNAFFEQLPAVLVLATTTQIPKMMGTGVTKTLAQAGTVAAGGVAAAAAAAYSIV